MEQQLKYFSKWRFLGSEHVLSTELAPLWDVLKGWVSLQSLGLEVQNVDIFLRGARAETVKKIRHQSFRMCKNVFCICYFVNKVYLWLKQRKNNLKTVSILQSFHVTYIKIFWPHVTLMFSHHYKQNQIHKRKKVRLGKSEFICLVSLGTASVHLSL